MKAICLQTYIPLRGKPFESSEMVSQILFGETLTIIEITTKWVYIKVDFDGYLGWCDAKLITILTTEQFNMLSSEPETIVSDKWISVQRKDKYGLQQILAGSVIYNLKAESFKLLNYEFLLCPQFPYKTNNTGNIITDTATSLLNVPYLWGGRSSFGIDCSGLVQTCCRIAGIKMQRDASQQVKQGVEVLTLQDSKQGDIVFFENEEGRVVHTGILLSAEKVIHSSGFVRIDPIDNNGIYNTELQAYTHRLKTIKRIIN